MRNNLSKVWAGGALALAVALALAGCSKTTPSTTTAAPTTSAAPLTILFGSSGDAETNAIKAAAAAWTAKSGIPVTVTPATNMDQELAQGFASGKPADVFYISPGALAANADAGNLWAYGDMLPNKADFYPALVADYTYKGKFYAAPKDYGTLQLIINDALWSAAGLSAADYPKTWDDLHNVAKKLTSGNVTGLVIGGQYERLGAFMVANGSNLMSVDQTKVTATDQSNVDALNFAKSMLADGSMKFAADISTGWGGEAFIKQLCAMTIEGNWISGAMKADAPNVKFTVVPMPASPTTGKQGTLEFSNGWGIAADSPNQQGALSLVEFLTTTEQQIAFAKAFGPTPSLQSGTAQFNSEFPAMKPFADGVAYAQGVPTIKGASTVLGDLNNQLAQLAKSDPAAILASTQTELQALLG